MIVQQGGHPPSRPRSRFLRRRFWIALVLAGCSEEIAGPSQPTVASLEIVEAPAGLLVADTVRLTVIARDSAGTAITLPVTWSVTDVAIAAVNSSGLVTGRAEGTTTIRVTSGTLSDSISLNITQGIRFTMLAPGANHTCGLDLQGAVYCWGANHGMNLGVETSTHECAVNLGKIACSPRPVRAAGGIQFTTLASGRGHSCGLDAEGRAHCWGDNGWEQLGATWDVTLGSHLPIRVLESPVFRALVVGGDFACGLTEAGAAFCWGSHGWGELGTGDLDLFTSAKPVAVVGGHQFVELVAGDAHACGRTDGGVAFCWGENGSGALGIGSVIPPQEWPAEPTPTAMAGGLIFSQLDLGLAFGCGLTGGNAAYCWGVGGRGKLGNGLTDNHVSPQPVSGGLTWRNLDLGWEHACGITSTGELACWGRNASGQLGVAATGEVCSSGGTAPASDCSTRPVIRPATPRRFASVVTGAGHTCALDELGYAFCWGQNDLAELGNGRIGGNTHIPSPVLRP